MEHIDLSGGVPSYINVLERTWLITHIITSVIYLVNSGLLTSRS